MKVPGGAGGWVVTDLATTSGSTTVTSASITCRDPGRVIQADNIPLLGAVSNAAEPNRLTAASDGTATLHRAATTGLTAFIGGDPFYAARHMGIVAPATHMHCFAAMDTSSVGNIEAPSASRSPAPSRCSSPPSSARRGTGTRSGSGWSHNGWVYFGTRKVRAIQP